MLSWGCYRQTLSQLAPKAPDLRQTQEGWQLSRPWWQARREALPLRRVSGSVCRTCVCVLKLELRDTARRRANLPLYPACLKYLLHFALQFALHPLILRSILFHFPVSMRFNAPRFPRGKRPVSRMAGSREALRLHEGESSAWGRGAFFHGSGCHKMSHFHPLFSRTK